MERLFVIFQMMYKSQFPQFDLYDWFCGPRSHFMHTAHAITCCVKRLHQWSQTQSWRATALQSSAPNHTCLEVSSDPEDLDYLDLVCLISVTVLLVCPGWPPDVSVCRAHGLLFVGAVCSHVDCLSPPILLLNHCFSGSSCVSLVTLVCLPI